MKTHIKNLIESVHLIESVLLIAMLSFSIASVAGEENGQIKNIINIQEHLDNKLDIPGFQRLSDVNLFTNLQDADNIIIPKGIYDKLEKEMGIIPDKQLKLGDKIEKNKNPTFIIVPNFNKKTLEIIPGRDAISYTSNITKLWNRTESITGIQSVDAYAVPDLDGDGLPDVLEGIFVQDSITDFHIVLKVRKGTNGNILWQTTIEKNSYATLSYVPDINGDHLGDVLLGTSNIMAHSSKFYAKIGKTGVNLWNDSATETNGFVSIYGYSPGDLNKDGMADIIELKIGYNSVTGNYYYVYKIRKGNDGMVLWTKSTSGKVTSLGIYSVGDINKDGNLDIMTVLHKKNMTTGNTYREVQMKTGSNGVNIWSSATTLGKSWRGGYIAPIGDISGDKVTDILYWDLSNSSSTSYTWTIRTKFGNNGTTMWTNAINGAKDQYWVWPEIVFDMSGDKVSDLLFSISNYGNITLKAQRGSNGNNLWSVYYGKGSYNFLNIGTMPLGDVNGDSILDIIVTIQKIKAGDETGILQVRSGKTGGYMWQESVNSPIYSTIWSLVPGDVNGDKITDIIINTVRLDSSFNMLSAYKVKRGNNGTDLWQESMVAASSSDYMFAMPGGDLNGDNRRDILKMSSQVPGEHLMTARLGPTGMTKWKVKSTGDNYIFPQPFVNLNGDSRQDILFTAGNEIYAITTK